MFTPAEFNLIVRANTVAIAQDTCLENVLEALLWRIREGEALSEQEQELKTVAEAITSDADNFLSSLLNRLERYESSVLGSAFAPAQSLAA